LEEELEKDAVFADSIQLVQRILYKEALEGFGDFKIGGQVIRIVRYADDL
jgi:hypothetical protein